MRYQPCCWVPFSQPADSRESLIQSQKNISGLILNDTQTNCHECYQREKTNYRFSGRLDANNYIPEDAVDGDAYILDFQLDTECNAACSICGPALSSLWQKQLGIIPLKQETHYDLYEQVDQLLSLDHVKQIKFFGGEPLLTKSHMIVLEKIPHPDQCHLMYSTNGSIFPNQNVIDTWKKFKKIKLSFSIDDIGSRFEYIRWPLKWSRVESNMIALAKSLPNIEVRIHCTLNPMNAFYIKELEQWIKHITEKENISVQFHLNPCFGVWGISATPPGLRHKLTQQYPDDHPVISILNNYPEVENTYLDLLKNMQQLDRDRNLDWKKTFPDLVDFFN